MELRRRVIFVGLIDTQFGFGSQPDQGWRSKAGNLVRKVFLEPASLEVTLVKFLARNSAFRTLRRFGQLAARLPAKTAFRCHYHLNYHLRVQAMYRWAFNPVDAPIYLFRTDEFPQSSAVSSWGALAEHLEIIPVGGTHLSILRPPAREMICRQFLKVVNAAAKTTEPPKPNAAAKQDACCGTSRRQRSGA
jgi:thioesterase domain-containing protein